MARIIDFVDHVNVMDDELSYREPQGGAGDFRMGSIVSVQEHQAAVFVSRGKILDVLGAGQHPLSTANLPILANLVGLITNGRNPFTADIYFINLKPLPNVRWGTSVPIEIDTRDGQFPMLAMGNGVAEVRIRDAAMFMQYAIGKPIFRLGDFRDQIQTMILGQLAEFLSRQGVKTIMQVNAVLSSLEGAVLAVMNEGFARFGMEMTSFDANNFQRKELTAEEAFNLYGDPAQRMQMMQLEVLKQAASNQGALGGTLGAGLGFGMGNMMAGMMNPQAQQMPPQQQMPPAAPPAQAPAPKMPETAAEVQQLLDTLDMRFMNGEISESTYNTMRARWEAKLAELRGK